MDYKSADEITQDIRDGLDPTFVVIETWRRIDELVQYIKRLEARLEALEP